MQVSCPICLDTFNGIVNPVSIPCGHVFHQHCLSRWFEESDKCPQCLQSFCISCFLELNPICHVHEYELEISEVEKEIECYSSTLEGMKSVHNEKIELLLTHIALIQGKLVQSQQKCESAENEEKELISGLSELNKKIHYMEKFQRKSKQLKDNKKYFGRQIAKLQRDIEDLMEEISIKEKMNEENKRKMNEDPNKAHDKLEN